MYAVQAGDGEMVKLLLDRGSDPELRDTLGNTLLHLAAVGGVCKDMVETALRLGLTSMLGIIIGIRHFKSRLV